MKNKFIFRKEIIIAVFIIIALIFIAVVIVNRNKQSDAEAIARSVLTKTYGVTLQDYKKLTDAITNSAENNTALFDYLYSIYADQITENGYNVFMNNRISSRATNVAYEENSDLKVNSIQLDSRDADEGSKRYVYTVEVEKAKEPAEILTFKGSIVLVKENGQWMVDGVTPQ